MDAEFLNTLLKGIFPVIKQQGISIAYQLFLLSPPSTKGLLLKQSQLVTLSTYAGIF